MGRAVQPWRTGLAGRPAVPLPPAPMPPRDGRRPLKRWRWVGVFDERLLLCAATVRIGPLPVAWWAVWDREARVLTERTVRRRDAVRLAGDRVRVTDGTLRIDLALDPAPAVETVSPHGGSYAWTRKQGGALARGTVRTASGEHRVHARAIVDDSAGYHARHTAWRWCAGVGTGPGGEPVAWNLCAGQHDDPRASENTVWVGGEPRALGPATFDGLHGVRVGGARLRFDAEAMRAHRDDLLVLASDYEAPLGHFGGTLPGVGAVTGAGVMERHAARW